MSMVLSLWWVHSCMHVAQEYWEMFDKHPHLQGGFIWDWVDQGLINTAQAPSGGSLRPSLSARVQALCVCMALYAVLMIPPAYS